MSITKEWLEERYIPEPNSGCWIWTLCVNKDGYAKTCIDGRGVHVHRLAYELYIGVIPRSMEMDHLCRVRCCINPAHLEPVTHAENMRRSMPNNIAANIAKARKRTHCPSGHLYSSDNIVYSEGYRVCRICSRNRAREYQRKKSRERRAVPLRNADAA